MSSSITSSYTLDPLREALSVNPGQLIILSVSLCTAEEFAAALNDWEPGIRAKALPDGRVAISRTQG